MAAIHEVPIDPSNAEQVRAWDGDQGEYWADHADRFDRAVAPYHQRLLEAAAITEVDRVLDIGCGTGQTTCDAARAAVDGSAFGVDLSARMLDVARRRAAAGGVDNASFQQADAQVHPFTPESFDVAISRTGAMFFGDAGAAFTNISRAMVPGGRLRLLTWQPLAANEWMREIPRSLAAGRELPAPPPGAPGPFSLSDPERVRSVLSASGFRDVDLAGSTAPMWFGADPDDARRFLIGLMGWMLDGLDKPGRARAVDSLAAVLEAHATADGVVFGSAAWVISATRA